MSNAVGYILLTHTNVICLTLLNICQYLYFQKKNNLVKFFLQIALLFLFSFLFTEEVQGKREAMKQASSTIAMGIAPVVNSRL